MARLLLTAGCTADGAPDEFGGATPLVAAAEGGHLETAEALVAAGALVESEAADGATALLVASGNGHPACVALLIGAGADVVS